MNTAQHEDPWLTIGQAAASTGLSAKMIRSYEQQGLLSSHRSAAGYRLYHRAQLQQLSFIRQARSLGFQLPQIRLLLQLWQNPSRPSRQVKQLAQQQLIDVTDKILKLQQMQQQLQQLVTACSDNEQPECAILQALAQGVDKPS